jgi:hypothetical protein
VNDDKPLPCDLPAVALKRARFQGTCRRSVNGRFGAIGIKSRKSGTAHFHPQQKSRLRHYAWVAAVDSNTPESGK